MKKWEKNKWKNGIQQIIVMDKLIKIFWTLFQFFPLL